MNERAESIQYTIRGVPRQVDLVLRQKAAQRKQSLNQVIVDELTRATIGRARKADFSDLVGQWTPDPAFDEILAAQRQIYSKAMPHLRTRWEPAMRFGFL
jgi:hypothetical protein